MLWPKTTLTLLADQREIADVLLKYFSNFLNFVFFGSVRVQSHFSAPHSKPRSRDSYSSWAIEHRARQSPYSHPITAHKYSVTNQLENMSSLLSPSKEIGTSRHSRKQMHSTFYNEKGKNMPAVTPRYIDFLSGWEYLSQWHQQIFGWGCWKSFSRNSLAFNPVLLQTEWKSLPGLCRAG